CAREDYSNPFAYW
nr:immunoglobulin heavy chain junction region [Mus musculus]